MAGFQPGTPITNSSNAPAASLGCFGEVGGKKVLISAAHVLFSGNNMSLAPNEPIYVGTAGRDRSSCCSSGEAASVKIGTTIKAWADGFRQIPSKPGFFDTDCAVAVLEKGISYSNEIPQIGMIQGIRPLPPPDWIMENTALPPDPKKMVRMYSPNHGGLRYGTLFYRGKESAPYSTSLSDQEFKADDDSERSMRPTTNQLLVIPRLLPNPGETPVDYVKRCKKFFEDGQKLTFSEADDSGSVVVDNEIPDQPKVIGILSRRFPFDALAAGLLSDGTQVSYVMRSATGGGIVTPIENVVQQLGVTIPANMSGTVPASRAPAYVMPRLLDQADLAGIEGALGQFRQRLAQNRHGRLVVAKLDSHRAEAQRLVNTARQVSATWQRCRGPAFIQHFIKNLRNPAHRVPLMIDGVTLEELLIRMRTILTRHGSPALVRDMARYGDFTIAALTGISNLHDLIDALEPERLEPA